MKNQVTVIIPTKNEEKNIARCLESIQISNFKPQTSIEIIVVDNQSTDETVNIAQKLGARVLKTGPERSSQRNFGAKKAKGEILFFIDADMEMEKEVIGQAIALLEKDRQIKAIIVPEISVGENYWASVRALERSCYLDEKTIEAARIFDKKAFLEIGGFDENLIAAEDWDLTQRIAKLGKIGRVKAKIIHHEGKLSLIAHLKKKYYYSKNIKFYAQKHQEMFKHQSEIRRVKIFAKNWRKLFADPILALGVFILKFLEYLVYLISKLI